MKQFFQISQADLARARESDCWPKACMEAHGAGDRKTEYIGSIIDDNGRVRDYYKDDIGCYWSGIRYREQDGRIVSEEGSDTGAKMGYLHTS